MGCGSVSHTTRRERSRTWEAVNLDPVRTTGKGGCMPPKASFLRCPAWLSQDESVGQSMAAETNPLSSGVDKKEKKSSKISVMLPSCRYFLTPTWRFCISDGRELRNGGAVFCIRICFVSQPEGPVVWHVHVGRQVCHSPFPVPTSLPHPPGIPSPCMFLAWGPCPKLETMTSSRLTGLRPVAHRP